MILIICCCLFRVVRPVSPHSSPALLSSAPLALAVTAEVSPLPGLRVVRPVPPHSSSASLALLSLLHLSLAIITTGVSPTPGSGSSGLALLPWPGLAALVVS